MQYKVVPIGTHLRSGTPQHTPLCNEMHERFGFFYLDPVQVSNQLTSCRHQHTFSGNITTIGFDKSKMTNKNGVLDVITLELINLKTI